jgi:hypothetical protein
MRRFPHLLIVLLCAAGAVNAQVMAPDGYLEALEALAQGDTLGGERLLLGAAVADPGFGPVWYELGLLRYYSRHDAEGARADLLEALSLGLPDGDAARARYVLSDMAAREWERVASSASSPAAIEAFLLRWPGAEQTPAARLLLAKGLTAELERSPNRAAGEALLGRFADLPEIAVRIGLVLQRLRLADLTRAGDSDGLLALAEEVRGTPLEREVAGAIDAVRAWRALQSGDAGALRTLLTDPRMEPHRPQIEARLKELEPPPAAPPAAPPAVAAVDRAAEEAFLIPPPMGFIVTVAGATLALAVDTVEIKGVGLLKGATVYRPRILLLVETRDGGPLTGVTFRGTLMQGPDRVVEVRELDLPGPFDPPLARGEEPRPLELLYSRGTGAGPDGTVAYDVSIDLSPDQGVGWVHAGTITLTGKPDETAGVAVSVTLDPTPPEAAP